MDMDRGYGDQGKRSKSTDDSKGKQRLDSFMASELEQEMERGLIGVSHDKMILIRQKKEEVERSYRQDCEIFSAVVKMLTSKDESIEAGVQASLRENLKDIGQRCIVELREFIDSLRTQQDT